MGLVMYLWGAPIAHGEFMLLRRCRRSAPACGFEHVGFWHQADIKLQSAIRSLCGGKRTLSKPHR